MSRYRHRLPQIGGKLFLNDGGMETTLIFHDGVDIPHFASFTLLREREGRRRLKDYYARYLAIARRHGVGFVLDAPTWRANPDWGAVLGYGPEALAAANADAIDLMRELRDAHDTTDAPVVIAGVIGPRGDSYAAGRMDAAEAEAYHAPQIATFAATEADMVAAYTLSQIDEAVGIARAARAAGIPAAISFTVETDGRLISGPSLREAIESVDAATGGAPAYYLVNCAHPTHFAGALAEGGAWRERILGIKANASRCSHAELDEAETLDDGDPEDLGRLYRSLRASLPTLRVAGGCCGTDHRHVAAIAANLLAAE